MGTGGGSFSPSTATPVAPRSGSHAGEGIRQAGKAIAQGVQRVEDRAYLEREKALRIQKMEREVALDDAELMARASALKLAEQSALYWGDSNAGITSTGSPEAKTFPYGTEIGPPLNMRPLTATGRKSAPLRDELINDEGWRYRVLSPDAGMDEIGQADLVYQWVMRKTRQARLALPRNIKIWLGQYKAARARRRNKTSGKKYRRKW